MAKTKKTSSVSKGSPIHQALTEIQEKGVTKRVENKFGGFMYLKISTIMVEISDILQKHGLRIRFSDDLVVVGDRYYVRALATIYDKDGNKSSAVAFAREQAEKKKMDDAQITGSCSTYARKYALCGLLGVEGEEDVDAKEQSEKSVTNQSTTARPASKPTTSKSTKPKMGEYILDGVKYTYKSVSSKKTGKTYTGFIPEMGSDTISGEKAPWFLGSKAAAFKKLKEAMDAEKEKDAEETIDVDDLPF